MKFKINIPTQHIFFNKFSALFLVIAIVIPLAYSLYTNHIWEDFFITFRFSKNLAEGNGLVYRIGERVHGFTSPIGVLLPSFFYLITGKSSYIAAIWLFRIISMLAFACGGLFMLSTFQNNKTKLPLTKIFFTLLYIFEAKSIAFSINGMETAFMILFLSWFLSVLQRGIKQNWFEGGLTWAGLMWTRPDGCMYIAAFSLACLVFADGPRKDLLKAIFKMGLVCAVIYLPWTIFTWIYYGNPVPHTIQAKSGGFHYYLKNFSETFVLRTGSIFLPINYHFGGWAKWLMPYAYFLWSIASFYWLIPLKDRFGRMCSFAFFLMFLYFFIAPPFSWYFPPITLLGLIVFARLAHNILTLLKDEKIIQWFVTVGIALPAVLVSLYFMSMTFIQMRVQQEVIENGNRKQIGLWLKENINEGDTVYLEPLGYIGYFSEAKMLDYPGLCSPEVVAARKEHNVGFYTTSSILKPDWILHRHQELPKANQFNYFKKHYTLVKKFSAYEEVRKYKFIPGRDYVLYDSVFYLFKRND